MNRLKGQSDLVTGANSGIGEAIARVLASKEANVVVNYMASKKPQQIVAEIKACGGGKR